MPFTIHGYPHTQNLAMASVGIFIFWRDDILLNLGSKLSLFYEK